MVRTYRRITKNIRILNYLLQTNILDDVRDLKYKTIEKQTEYIDYYGWNDIHLYANGIYKLNNGTEISFDYCYEIDQKNIKNIKKVIYCNLVTI